MSGWPAALIGLIVVLNPVGVSRAVAWGDRGDPTQRNRFLAIVAGAAALLAALVLITGPLLELVDLSTPTFRLGVSVVMGLTGARWLLVPVATVTEAATPRDEALTLGATLLLAPGPVLAAMAGGADGGIAAGLISVVVAMAVTAALLVIARLSDPGASAGSRLIGAVAIVVAVSIGIDSARTV